MLETPSCKALIGELAKKLDVSLDKDQIRGYVIEAGKNQKEKIKSELKNKLVFLKFDCATRIRTNYLGVNVRFVTDENKAVTRTLAVVDTKSQHTASELKGILDDVLDDYNIAKSNIVLAVTDNASNMVKLMRDLNTEVLAPSSTSQADDSDDEDLDDDYDDVSFDVRPGVVQMGVGHQRCGAHTQQLSVADGINESCANSLLHSVRQVVKSGRNTSAIKEYILKETGKTLLLDVETRWGSIYIMCKRLIELKDVIQNCVNMGNSSMKLTSAQWKMVSDLTEVLHKAYDVTLKIQYNDCTAGYFYRKWTALCLFYENHGSRLAQGIFDSMKRREDELFNGGGGCLMAAVYIDVYNMELIQDGDVLAKCVDTIVHLALRMKGLELEPEDSVVDLTVRKNINNR